MSLRQFARGTVLALAIPGLIYFALKLYIAYRNQSPQDFAYHDNYFLAGNVGWAGYLACAVLLLALYCAAVASFNWIWKRIKPGR